MHSASPEGKVLVGVSRKVEGVRLIELPLVTVGRTEHREHQLSPGYFGPRDLEVLPGVAFGRDLDGRRVPQQLLDRGLDELWIGPEFFLLLGVFDQRERAAGDKVYGGLMSRHEEQERHGQEFILAEFVSRLLRLDERAHEIVLWRDAPPL